MNELTTPEQKTTKKDLKKQELKEQIVINKFDQKDEASYITNLNIYIFYAAFLLIAIIAVVLKVKSNKKKELLKKEADQKEIKENEHYQDYKEAVKSLDE